ncbi:hypothetical protein ACLKA6_017614 [Drosophila palustris]
MDTSHLGAVGGLWIAQSAQEQYPNSGVLLSRNHRPTLDSREEIGKQYPFGEAKPTASTRATKTITATRDEGESSDTSNNSIDVQCAPTNSIFRSRSSADVLGSPSALFGDTTGAASNPPTHWDGDRGREADQEIYAGVTTGSNPRCRHQEQILKAHGHQEADSHEQIRSRFSDGESCLTVDPNQCL